MRSQPGRNDPWRKAARRTARAVVFVLCGLLFQAPAAFSGTLELIGDMAFLGGFPDRSTGSRGAELAATYILNALKDAGVPEVRDQRFLLPVPASEGAAIEVAGVRHALHPFGPNLATLPVTPPGGVTGPLVDGGRGEFSDLSGKPLFGAVVLLDMASGSNWTNAVMLGARAVIFLGGGGGRAGFEEKETPTPLAFPRFWTDGKTAAALREAARGGATARVESRARWVTAEVRNIYGVIPGTHPTLKNDLVILEAHYDAATHLVGVAPGADEAVSIAMLLETARAFRDHPPERTVMIAATVGHGQSLEGARRFIRALTSPPRYIRREKAALDARKSLIDKRLSLIGAPAPLKVTAPEDREILREVLVERAKDRADLLTREIQYEKVLGRSEGGGAPSVTTIEEPFPYRRLSWTTDLSQVRPEDEALALRLITGAKDDLLAESAELKNRMLAADADRRLRGALGDTTPVLFLSLNLTSRTRRLGVVEWGTTYPLQDLVRERLRALRFARILGEAAPRAAAETRAPNLYVDLSRGSYSGKDATVGPLSSDVAALSELPAVALCSLDDARSSWGTPEDTLEHVNTRRLEELAGFVPALVRLAVAHPHLSGSCEPGPQGLTDVEGHAMFKRQGELFPDQPAFGTLVSGIQGGSVFRALVNRDGTFFMPGVANGRVSYYKLILEPYRVDPETGRITATADKAQTGKDNYRLKIRARTTPTTLIMFHCRQTDIAGVFDPQRMSYLTKVQLLDAATEATPLRYWYSRADGRDTMAMSVFLEKGTRFKLIMSDSLLRKSFLLLGCTPERLQGAGFLIGEPASIPFTPRQVADDMYLLVGERLGNLQERGIVNRHLDSLLASAGGELTTADRGLSDQDYDRFFVNVVSAWAKLGAIYDEVEATQRDVLAGVMFFIALFVPFAYCLERYLFCFRNVYKQIGAFFTILLATIFTIRALHPAFQLTYSPMVVIIAFFIVGLSVAVSWIIFVRFEHEMETMRARGSAVHLPRASTWQAFGAGFVIGGSNLNRRKLRTALTCATLVILTFTVMSFTNVKSLRSTTRARLAPTAPYRGVLLHQPLLTAMTPVALEDLRARFGAGTVFPRGWAPLPEPGARTVAEVVGPRGTALPVEGVLGAGENPPEALAAIVKHGKWLSGGDPRSILLPVEMAVRLGLDPAKGGGAEVSLFGDTYKVCGFFEGQALQAFRDLDQNPVTPAYLEITRGGEELSEVEIEAMQAGEEITPASERFRYADAPATVIIPFGAMEAYGGDLRAVSILSGPSRSPSDIADSLGSWLAFPLFVGEDGVFYESASVAVRYQGVSNILIPLLIVILICLNTMIGHVYERQKEIGTYTAVGLAPTHVGFLFIVEALSMAVLATVTGYILAQFTAKFLGGTALFSQLTFNYSSLASVACMLLVFSVVFVSALYPARMAAHIAMPDVTRTWTLPAASDDTITLNLPFLLKYEEEQGILGFLREFFESQQDVASGQFITDETDFTVVADDGAPAWNGGPPAPSCLYIRTNVWLAPFDLGIKQRVLLHCCPSLENPGYLEVSVTMTRLSGEVSAWVRTDRTFIGALRKRMLLWRFLPLEKRTGFEAGVARALSALSGSTAL